MIPLGVSQLHDLENSRTQASFSYSVTFIVFDYILILSMGSNTGKSDVTILQHICFGDSICYRTFSRALKSLLERLVPKESAQHGQYLRSLFAIGK